MLVLGLGACATAGGGSGATGPGSDVVVPEYYYALAFSAAVADSMAARCGSLGFRRDAEAAALALVRDRLIQDGYRAGDLDRLGRKVDQGRIRSDFTAYMAQNRIDMNNPATLCNAGQRELRAQSDIGKLLKEVS